MQFFKRKKGDSEWIGISDIMSGLMMVFMFIAVAFMLKEEEKRHDLEIEIKEMSKISKELEYQKMVAEQNAEKLRKTQDAIREIALTFQKSQQSLNQDLHKEFDRDLKRWGAEITKDNRIRFNSPHILFKSGRADISTSFQNILKELFPRYIKILTSYKYQNEIDEIRVEGHTSYGWGRAKDFDFF